MRIMQAGFVTAEGFDWPSKIGHEIVGGTVKLATRSKFAHAYVVLDVDGAGSVTYEMLKKGITRTDGIVYTQANTKALEIYDIPISDEEYAKIFELLQGWFDSHVGYAMWTGCFGAGAAAVTHNDKVGNEIDEHFNERFNTKMCSEMSTELVRVPKPDLLPGRRAGSVWPDLERQACRDEGFYCSLSWEAP